MSDLLTPLEAEQARAHGFEVCHVFDATDGKWLVQALPTDKCAVKSAAQLQQILVERARNRDALAIRVLHLIMAHAKTAPKPTKPKRGRK